MEWARAVPGLVAVALLLTWISLSIVYQDYAAEVSSYLADRGLLQEGPWGDMSKKIVLQNRKDIDAILQKLGMSKTPP